VKEKAPLLLQMSGKFEQIAGAVSLAMLAHLTLRRARRHHAFRCDRTT
jgi:MYXO-CTERM domain-containing protein